MAFKKINVGRGSVLWQKPPEKWLKCNVDAAIFKSKNHIGLGCVVRDDAGCFVAARSHYMVGQPDLKLAKALSFHEALSWIKNQGNSQIIIECDAMTVISALQSSYSDMSMFGMIIKDCKAILS